MTLVSSGPYETHLDADPWGGRQRYFDGPALGYPRGTLGPYPILLTGLRVNIECGTWFTLYASGRVGGGGGAGSYRVGVRLFDPDNVTQRIDMFFTAVLTPLAAGPGVWISFDVSQATAPMAGTNPRAVWRVAMVIFEVSAGVNTDAILDARLFVRTAPREQGG